MPFGLGRKNKQVVVEEVPSSGIFEIMMNPPSISSLLKGDTDAVLFFGITALIAGLIMAAMYFATSSGKKKRVALDPDEWQGFPLVKKETLSHDTKRYTFALQTPYTKLGLPIGQHIAFRFTDKDGKAVLRSYTPVTGDETLGKVVFVIKVYKAGVHPKFPDGGKMSQYVDSLQLGDTLDMKGPKGHMTYNGRGKFTITHPRNPPSLRRAKRFGMIAGGTGITPMLQVIEAILRDPNDTTTVSLLFANQTEEDILVRDELEALAIEHPTRFKLHYTLDRPPSKWKYSMGFVTKDMILAHLPSFSPDTHVLMCGPPPMLKFALIPALKEIGFTDEQYFSF